MRLMTIPERVDRNLAVWETVSRLFGLFAGLGLLLAALGIYGVVSRLVAQRTNEIGLRMALGAQLRDIFALVLGNGVRVTLVGAAVGVGGSLGLSRYLTAAAPAFGGSDVRPIVAAAVLLIGVAVLSCLLPARRAVKVDPMTALRCE